MFLAFSNYSLVFINYCAKSSISDCYLLITYSAYFMFYFISIISDSNFELASFSSLLSSFSFISFFLSSLNYPLSLYTVSCKSYSSDSLSSSYFKDFLFSTSNSLILNSYLSFWFSNFWIWNYSSSISLLTSPEDDLTLLSFKSLIRLWRFFSQASNCIIRDF